MKSPRAYHLFQPDTDFRSDPALFSIPLFVLLLDRRVAERRVEKLSLSRQLLGTDGVTVDSQRGFDIAVAQHRGDYIHIDAL